MAEQRQATDCLKDPLLCGQVGPAPRGRHSRSSPAHTCSEQGWALPWGLPTYQHQPRGGPARRPGTQEGSARTSGSWFPLLSVPPHRAVAPNFPAPATGAPMSI